MKKNKSVIQFLLLALGIFLAWYCFYDLWMLKDGRLDSWLSRQVAVGSGLFLQLIGYGGAVKNTTVYIDLHPMVFVGNACNGLILMALFVGFIVAFPGPWKQKIFYIPAGVVFINLLNILRVVALALTALYAPDLLDFNHKYTFTFVVYACIFGLWMLWVKKFSNIATTHRAPEQPVKVA